MAVFGCGGVGLSAVMGAAAAGAAPVVAVDVSLERAQAAAEFGATAAVVWDTDAETTAERVRAATGGGVDHAFEATGRPEAMRAAFLSTRPRGQAVLMGIPRLDAELRVPARLIPRGERRVIGALYGSSRPERDFPLILDAYRRGRLPLDRLISHRLPLEQIEQGFELLRGRRRPPRRPRAGAGGGGVRITAVETRTYRFALDPPLRAAWDPQPRTHQEATLVLVSTDEGVRGCASGDALPDAVLLERLVLGLDPFRTEVVRELCETVDFHGGRPWTLEVAVWDVVGRALGEPLWRLLGGRSESLLAYASNAERLPAPERAARCVELRDAGVHAVKLRFHDDDWRRDVEVVEVVRDAVGPDMRIMVDANQGWRMAGDLTPRWDVATALAVRPCARAALGRVARGAAAHRRHRRLRRASGGDVAAAGGR